MPFSASEISAFREAGRISAMARDRAVAEVRPGVLLRHVQEAAEQVIRDEGAAPSFPAQTSRNSIAAHYCSSTSDPSAFVEGDLVKVDVGAHVDGYPADTGVTVDLSPDGRWATLAMAASDALDAAIAQLRDGITTGEVGEVVEQTIRAAGFEPVGNLTGHGLERWTLHASPHVPNVATPGGQAIRTGAVLAIEPFATNGDGLVRDEGRAEVFSQTFEPFMSNRMDRISFDAISRWKGLPFARRYFTDLPQKPFERTLKELLRQRAAHSYSPLVEVAGGMVAWKEHTIYLSPEGPEVLTV